MLRSPFPKIKTLYTSPLLHARIAAPIPARPMCTGRESSTGVALVAGGQAERRPVPYACALLGAGGGALAAQQGASLRPPRKWSLVLSAEGLTAPAAQVEPCALSRAAHAHRPPLLCARAVVVLDAADEVGLDPADRQLVVAQVQLEGARVGGCLRVLCVCVCCVFVCVCVCVCVYVCSRVHVCVLVWWCGGVQWRSVVRGGAIP